jgi:hypothetical protein
MALAYIHRPKINEENCCRQDKISETKFRFQISTKDFKAQFGWTNFFVNKSKSSLIKFVFGSLKKLQTLNFKERRIKIFQQIFIILKFGVLFLQTQT